MKRKWTTHKSWTTAKAAELWERAKDRIAPCPICGGDAWTGAAKENMCRAHVAEGLKRNLVRHLYWKLQGNPDMQKGEMMKSKCSHDGCLAQLFLQKRSWPVPKPKAADPANRYGCYDRAPFHPHYHVQDGYNPMSKPEAATRSPKIKLQASAAHESKCSYTESKLGQTDPKCAGCKWKA